MIPKGNKNIFTTECSKPIKKNRNIGIHIAITLPLTVVEIIAPKLGEIKNDKGAAIKVDKNLRTVASVLYDAVYVPGGKDSIAALMNEADAIYFVDQAYKHCKAIAVDVDAENFIAKTTVGSLLKENKELPGFVYGGGKNNSLPASFIKAIAQHRFWERETMTKVPA